MRSMNRRLMRCLRSPLFWPAGIGFIAVVFAAALAVFGPQGAGKVEAYTIETDGRLTINMSQVQVIVNCYEASYNNLFGIQSPSPLQGGQPSPRDLFYCKDQPSNIAIGTFGQGELVFRIKTPSQSPGPQPYTWQTGPGSRNADGLQHAHLTRISDTVVRIGWEDLYGGGDQDFNDCVVDVTIEELPTATPTATNTPVPTATFTPTATPTALPTDTPTSTPTYTPTPTNTYTPTPTPTNTYTPTPTPTPTFTPVPPTPTFTPTPTNTYTPTPTITPTPTNTYTSTPTFTPIPPTPTFTPTPTKTYTPTPTFTPIPPTPTFTPTPTRTFTPTPTRTPTPTNTPGTPIPPTPTSTHTPGHPPGVGGAVKLPPAAIAAESGAPSKDSTWPVATYAALAGGVAAVIAVAAGGWYTSRRRWLR